jgi:hypothetical protein
MTDWFAKLMQEGHARSRPAVAGAGRSRKAEGRTPDVQADRHAAIVRAVLAREAVDRAAREKRLAGYRQAPESGPASEGGASSAVSGAFPPRVYRFATKVPCRVTPAGRALFEEIRRRWPGGTAAFQPAAGGRQAVMLTEIPGAEPRQIGWVEHCIQTDPMLCNVRHQGLTVDSDGDAMLVLRFRYPATAASGPVRRGDGLSTPRGAVGSAAPLGEDPAAIARSESSDGAGPARDATAAVDVALEGDDQTTWVDFSEIRPALEMRMADGGALPPLAMLSPHEIDLINATGSRDYEAFYARFKHELLAGVWHALTSVVLSSSPSRWHRGLHYTVVREPEAAVGRIHQITVADDGRVTDIGMDRVYDASAATELLVLHLAGDILADITEIFFAIQRLAPAEADARREEFFALVRRFWSGAQSLASPFGGDPTAVARMALRALPTPVQASLLRSDWTSLRQILIARYGERGQQVADLPDTYPSGVSGAGASWPFALYPAGEINVGLRLVYRQEWRFAGSRSEVVQSLPLRPKDAERVSIRRTRGNGGRWTTEEARPIAAAAECGDPVKACRKVVREAVEAVAGVMKWPAEVEGGINIGLHGLAASTDMGLESERRESSRHASSRITESVRRVAGRILSETDVVVSVDTDESDGSASAGELREPLGEVPITHVYSRLLNQYDVVTHLSEVQNVVMVAEALPAPAEIDFWWVRRHRAILAAVLLDESCRGALESIGQAAPPPLNGQPATDLLGARDTTTTQLDSFAGTVTLRAESIDMVGEWKRGRREDVGEWQRATLQGMSDGVELPALEVGTNAERDRLYEHLRANILHYQQAIWQEEDPQQRAMRYRKSGNKVPLDWRFELRSGTGLTVDELGDRLAAKAVDGQFAAYAGGREASLDQVIDAGSPIGYYGNCAVYPMRPQFASDELFSMLHFFRSPYLRPDQEEGFPVVTDPVLIQISEDPEVAAVSNQVLDRDREEMVRYVPELRRELVRAGGKAGGTAAAETAESSRRQYAALRRHYAEYRYRRAHSRRVVLDTGRVLLEVVGGVSPRHGSGHGGIGVMPVSEAVDRWAVRVGRESGVLRTHGHRGPEADPVIVAAEHAGLFVGAGAGGRREPEPDPGIVVQRVGAPSSLVAGAAPTAPAAPDPEPVRINPGDVGLMMTWGAQERAATPGEGDPEPRPLILAATGGAAASLLAGAGGVQPHGPGGDPIVIVRVAGVETASVRAAAGAAPPLQQALDAGGIVQPAAGMEATVVSGAGYRIGPHGDRSTISEAADEGLAASPSASAGAAASDAAAPASGIGAPVGGDPAGILLAGLGTGQRHGPRAERSIIVPAAGGQEPSLVSGALAA